MTITITLAIIIITCLVSYRAIQDRTMINNLAHWPYATARNNEWYRFFSSGLVHNDYLHLGINMFVLWSFGTNLEYEYELLFGATTGKLLFLIMYITAIIAAGIPSFMKHRNNEGYRAVGASGAVSGIFLASALFNPWGQVYLMGVIPLPFIVAAVGFLIYEQYASKKANDNIGHDAHFYGAIYAVAFTLMLKPELFNIFSRKFINGLPF